MNKPCISIDISKGKSFYQGFENYNQIFSKAKEVIHDIKGFSEIKELTNRLLNKTGSIPIVVFESTGIYHKPLQTYLDEQNIKYTIVSPLLSAKVRKSQIRSTKTDKKDCQNIAKVFYMNDCKIFDKQETIYDEIRNKSRYYDTVTEEKKRLKVEFRRLLDIVYPNFDKLYTNVYGGISLLVIKEYPHPELIRKKSVKAITANLRNKSTHKEAYCQKEAEKIKIFSENCASGCVKQSYTVHQMKKVLNNLIIKTDELNEELESLIFLAKETVNFRLIKSISGIGENLAARLTAEIGDIKKFNSADSLVAYAGIDPKIYRSGKISGEGLRITKKGNKHLRTLLYLAVTSMVKTKRDNIIVDFYNKKKRQERAMSSKAAFIACSNKLLRIIYSMCKNGCLFNNHK